MSPFRKIVEDKFPDIERFGHFIRSSVWKNQFTETVRELVSSIDFDDFNLSSLSLEQIQSSAINGKSKIGKYSIYEIINNKDFSKAFLCVMIPFNKKTIF